MLAAPFGFFICLYPHPTVMTCLSAPPVPHPNLPVTHLTAVLLCSAPVRETSGI
uniref:Uncharacterized protein n=1 Tax=Rhizophora mucronata TaxID=61149 RepID=A0A2P2QZH0_RHIMU